MYYLENHCLLTVYSVVVVYRDLQVGWGAEAELKVTHASIVNHNTVQHYSQETQLCTCCGYQLKLQSFNLPANLCMAVGITAIYHGRGCIHGYKQFDVIVHATRLCLVVWTPASSIQFTIANYNYNLADSLTKVTDLLHIKVWLARNRVKEVANRLQAFGISTQPSCLHEVKVKVAWYLVRGRNCACAFKFFFRQGKNWTGHSEQQQIGPIGKLQSAITIIQRRE